jgi:GTP-binding protein HflX
MSSGYPCRVVFSDTVGFIKKLPHQLVESFKSTLEEVCLADVLLHVVDISDQNFPENMAQTGQVLTEIGAGSVPQIIVYNKIDNCEDFQPPPDDGHKGFPLSALRNYGLDRLKAELIAISSRRRSQKS